MPRNLPFDPMELIKELTIRLEDAGIPDAGREAELLVTHFSGQNRTALWRDHPALDDSQIKEIQSALERRLRREPLQYIIGEVEFWGLEITVGPGVLIPRPETELLVEEVLRQIDNKSVAHVLDLCTGSGCLALALAKELPEARVTGTDISPEALSFATRNAIINNIANTRFLEGPLFAPVTGERFGLIVSNPPYIPRDDIPLLQPEIAEHEPHGALDGGPDGLSFYRLILQEAPDHLTSGGVIALELGMGQAGDVSAMAREAGLEMVSVRKDLAGIERILMARRP